MKLTAKILVVLLGLVASACDMADGDSGPICYDSLDCPPDQKCDLSTNRCYDHLPPQAVVDFELTPGGGSGCGAMQIPEKDLANLLTISDVELEMTNSVLVSGQVMSYVPGGVPGTLVFTRHPLIDNRCLACNISVIEDGTFFSEVSPGTNDIIFKPSNRADLPYFMLSEFVVPDDEAGELELTNYLEIPKYPTEDELNTQTELLLVRGQVLQSQSYPHPVTGLKVEGHTGDGLRTSQAEPDEQGYFYLRLPVTRTVEGNGDLVDTIPELIDIVIRPGSSDARLPTVTVEGVELEGPELGVFYLGEVPQPLSVTGVVTDRGGNPIPECMLHFRAENIGNGTFSHQMQATSSGEFSTNLPPGTYQITAVPPLLSQLRVGKFPLVLFENIPDLVIMLEMRPTLQGTVSDNEGNRVGDIIVRAKRLSEVSGVDDGVVRTYEGITESNGTFAIPVDSGIFNVSFIPPAASGLPRIPKPMRVYVTGDEPEYEIAAELPAPAVIQGHVYSMSGEPQCSVNIDVYNSDEENAYLIGQTISDGPEDGCTGAYTVIVPEKLVSED
jgi:hypothetical protein